MKSTLLPRYLFIIAFFSLSSIDAAEQPSKVKYAEKGVMELSGRVSAAYTTSDSSRRIWISLSPGLNYFLRNNWYLGTALGVSYEKRDSDIQSYPDLTWSTGVSPSAHLGYANSLTEKWHWFAEAGFAYGVYNCNYCGGSFSRNQLFSNGGLKYDVGNGLVAFGVSLSRNSVSSTNIELFLGLSVYF